MSNAHDHTSAHHLNVEEKSAATKGAVGAAAGAAAGAATGAITGPIGAAIGALIGGAVGVAAGIALRNEEQEQQVHDEELDRDIGVIGGDMGAASPDQPPPQRGHFHAAALGVSSPSSEPSEGIIPNVDAAK